MVIVAPTVLYVILSHWNVLSVQMGSIWIQDYANNVHKNALVVLMVQIRHVPHVKKATS